MADIWLMTLTLTGCDIQAGLRYDLKAPIILSALTARLPGLGHSQVSIITRKLQSGVHFTAINANRLPSDHKLRLLGNDSLKWSLCLLFKNPCGVGSDSSLHLIGQINCAAVLCAKMTMECDRLIIWRSGNHLLPLSNPTSDAAN